jgi:hypothetical protein
MAQGQLFQSPKLSSEEIRCCKEFAHLFLISLPISFVLTILLIILKIWSLFSSRNFYYRYFLNRINTFEKV